MPKHFDPDTEIPDLQGKVIVVTGGNAGLGAETIRRLVIHNPSKIFLCARSLTKAAAFISSIEGKSVTIIPILCDQASLTIVKSAAEQILNQTDRIDLLFLNAGIAFTSPALTTDGYEDHFGVNHVAHALLTQLLLPPLLKTACDANSDVRVISIASEAGKTFAPKTGLVLGDVRSDMSTYAASQRYGQSKLANMLFAKALAQRYPSLTSVSLHPGLVRTGNINKATDAGWFWYLWSPMLWLSGVNVEEGAKTQLWAAMAKGVESGKYYIPIGRVDDGVRHLNDQRLVDELWAWTESELARYGGSAWAAVV